MIAARPMPRSGSGWVSEVAPQQRDLGVARGREEQALQQVGERDHGAMCEGMGTACHPCRYPAPRTRQPLPAISSHGGAPGPLTNSGLMDAEHADKRGAVASARAPRVQVQDVCCEAARRPRPIRVFSVRPFCICAASLACGAAYRTVAARGEASPAAPMPPRPGASRCSSAPRPCGAVCVRQPPTPGRV